MGIEGGRPLSAKQEKRIETLIGGLEAPAKELLRQLSPEIEKGGYNCILGIDVSGRIPTLLLSEVIKKRYADLHYPSPNVLFLAGGVDLSDSKREAKKEEIGKYVKSLVEKGTIQRDKKILVVEDTALSAQSMRIVTDMLLNEGIPFEAAVFATLLKQDELEERIGAKTHSIFRVGDTSITHKHDLAGVEKKHDELFSHPRESARGNAVMRGTRDEISEVAKELSVWYEDHLTGSNSEDV